MELATKLLTVKKYLEAEAKSQIRHEYLGGQIFAMVGASKQHNLIALNISSLFRFHLRGNPCQAFMSDMKVRIKTANNKADLFYYPDIVVTCNPEDKEDYFLQYPCLIVEVLSPSTETIDRREKWLNYQTISTLEEYILVAQNTMKVEIFRKDNHSNWQKEILTEGDTLEINSINFNLTITDIYDEVF